MPRGGARINSGPPPDPNALRRSRPGDRDGWTTLPATGFSGKIPPFPMLADVRLAAQLEVAQAKFDDLEVQVADAETAAARRRLGRQLDDLRTEIAEKRAVIEHMTKIEADVWAEIWRTPQASAWARLGWKRDVAQYVRHKALAELGSMDDAKEARQWSDRLGLNPAAMMRNRWRVADDAPAPAKRASGAAAAPRASSSRSRLTVVKPGE